MYIVKEMKQKVNKINKKSFCLEDEILGKGKIFLCKRLTTGGGM